jgi:hypothetical protein
MSRRVNPAQFYRVEPEVELLVLLLPLVLFLFVLLPVLVLVLFLFVLFVLEDVFERVPSSFWISLACSKCILIVGMSSWETMARVFWLEAPVEVVVVLEAEFVLPELEVELCRVFPFEAPVVADAEPCRSC